MGLSVQFYGSQQVLAAAQNINCPAWAIYNGRMLFLKYEGSDENESIAMLDNALNMLSESQSTAIYTLKFFESEEGQKIKINEKSVCTGGSFNFKLIEPEQRAVVQMGGTTHYSGAVVRANESIDKITELLARQQEQINTLIQAQQQMLEEEEEEEETEPETLTGVLIDTLKNPDKLMSFIGAIKHLTGGLNQPAQVAAIGGTGYAGNGTAAPAQQPGAAMTEEEAEQRLIRLGNAIDYLNSVDPQLLEHLEKLVEMEKKQPGKLKSILAWL